MSYYYHLLYLHCCTPLLISLDYYEFECVSVDQLVSLPFGLIFVLCVLNVELIPSLIIFMYRCVLSLFPVLRIVSYYSIRLSLYISSNRMHAMHTPCTITYNFLFHRNSSGRCDNIQHITIIHIQYINVVIY